jgi:hypothetical protein
MTGTWSESCCLARLEPFAPAWLDRALERRLGDWPRDGTFARKRAPGAFLRKVSGTNLHAQQLSHDGDGHRAFDPLRIRLICSLYARAGHPHTFAG